MAAWPAAGPWRTQSGSAPGCLQQHQTLPRSAASARLRVGGGARVGVEHTLGTEHCTEEGYCSSNAVQFRGRIDTQGSAACALHWAHTVLPPAAQARHRMVHPAMLLYQSCCQRRRFCLAAHIHNRRPQPRQQAGCVCQALSHYGAVQGNNACVFQVGRGSQDGMWCLPRPATHLSLCRPDSAPGRLQWRPG